MNYVYAFDAALPEGTGRSPQDLLGGKGAGLGAMTRLGISVPPGFTIATDVCAMFASAGTLPLSIRDAVVRELARVESAVGRRFGDQELPLLVSVRSGARVSMPGMMDTILNLGLNDKTAAGLAKATGDARFALDAYRRLLQMYGDVVLGVDHEHFEEAMTRCKIAAGHRSMPDSALSASALETLVADYHGILKNAGKPFPQDPMEQLWGAIGAVFGSWQNTRAVRYRKMQGITADGGTACTIQAMVFGNRGESSGSGVLFTRNPSTGERSLYGEYLANAQGEDVVAGIRTPLPLSAAACMPGRENESLERQFPAVFQEVAATAQRLEAHFGDMQDVEFTVEEEKVYILQTRNGKRTAQAAVRVAVDMVNEGVLTPERAVLSIEPRSLEQLLHARLPTPAELAKSGIIPIAGGLPASPGAAVGTIVFDADSAERMAAEGKVVVLVRRETSPEDIHGMKAAAGIVTATGGMTSHAAVVARGLGKCCVAGVSALSVDYAKQELSVRLENKEVRTYRAGDFLSLDGSAGKIYEGELDVVPAATVPELEQIMTWADSFRRMKVRANADTPSDARRARRFGAQGIGLCRTEHMFFSEERVEAMRALVLVDTDEQRAHWLSVLEPMQRGDFEAILQVMDGLPVTIRLLDWPLHEFLPKEEKDFASVASAIGVSAEVVKRRASAMHEVNPMLGHRAVRVGLTSPSIYAMQIRAILGAVAARVAAGGDPRVEVMIPVVGVAQELRRVKADFDHLLAESGVTVAVKYGTMIELPRACLVADELASVADFFSFGTNDLTQTTFGLSRDDAGRFLPQYMDALGILATDPFATIDRSGVGQLMDMACRKARAVKAISLGVCGEHGGDPDSIEFCEELGLDYVSCSPPRLPVARLACAQATLKLRK